MCPIGLHGHFRPPLSARRHWHAFSHCWAASIAAGLNELLPPKYFAEPNVQFGIEIVTTFEESASTSGGSVVPAWARPSPICWKAAVHGFNTALAILPE